MPGEIDDDMAIVVVRTSAVDLASWECTFPAEPIRVSEARRLAQADVPQLGHGPRAGRPGLPAGVRGRDQRGAARGRLAQPRGMSSSWSSARSRRSRVLADDWSGSPFGDDVAAPRARSSRSGCAAGRPRSGSRSSTPTCGCRGSAARGRTTRAAAGSTSSTSSPPGGDRGRPTTARPSGSRCRSRTGRGAADRRAVSACPQPQQPRRSANTAMMTTQVLPVDAQAQAAPDPDEKKATRSARNASSISACRPPRPSLESLLSPSIGRRRRYVAARRSG